MALRHQIARRPSRPALGRPQPVARPARISPAHRRPSSSFSARRLEWVVLSRPDCSLCHEFLAEFADLLSAEDAAGVKVVDVDQDPALARKYGQRIPVLLADGEFVCDYRLDRERVLLHIGR
ncbi:MAG: glutaredoxin family protein [Steroidobacter sp.]